MVVPLLRLRNRPWSLPLARPDIFGAFSRLAAAVLCKLALSIRTVTKKRRPYQMLTVAGLLVGFGTRLGNGCTSGHGVCGVSRLSARSMVATATFIVSGAVIVFVVNHLG